jgi:hypothetical protein
VSWVGPAVAAPTGAAEAEIAGGSAGGENAAALAAEAAARGRTVRPAANHRLALTSRILIQGLDTAFSPPLLSCPGPCDDRPGAKKTEVGRRRPQPPPSRVGQLHSGIEVALPPGWFIRRPFSAVGRLAALQLAAQYHAGFSTLCRRGEGRWDAASSSGADSFDNFDEQPCAGAEGHEQPPALLLGQEDEEVGGDRSMGQPRAQDLPAFP